MSCQSFLYTCGFETQDIPIEFNDSSKRFIFVHLDFSYKLIFGGDRKFYFVLPDDKLLVLRPIAGTKCPEYATEEKHILTLYEYPEMTLIKEVECAGIIIDIEQYIPENIEFIPNQYFRNYSDCYIVDKWKRHVLKLGSLLQFQNLYTLDHEIKTIVTGTVSPYFLVQFENKTILDLSSKLSNVQFPNIEIECGSASNTGVILVDKFNTIHIYETSAYIKSQLGIDSNGDDERKIKFESTNKTVMGSIDEVHAGFFHVVFKTRDGRVFAAGYDNLKQSSLGTNTGDCNFTEQSKLLQIDPCTRLGCLSRGQYLITSKNDIYFISEMFSNFPQSKFTHKQYNFVNVMNFDEIEIQTREFRDGSPYNTIVNAGWQCCIAFDHRLHSKPSRFRTRLFECSLNCKIPDISLNFQ